MEGLGNNEASSTFAMEPPTLEQLKACQFSNWYPTFRNLNGNSNANKNENPKRFKRSNVTIRSVVISPLPLEFIEYLKADGVILPKGAEKVSSFLPTETNDDWSSSVEDEEDPDENDTEEKETPHFPALNDEIQRGLDSLGGYCMPKLNWSAPKDVTWLNESTLKCGTVGDVYLLLKSSDFCMFDLEHALSDVNLEDYNGEDEDDNGKEENEGKRTLTMPSQSLEYELILRKWSNLHASMEFRIFVSHHNPVAISQRNHTQHYPHLKKERMEIRSLIDDFFHNYVRENYGRGLVSIPNYILDVYVDKNEKVWLIDFNPWCERTDALLFTWEEIVNMSNEAMLENGGGTQANHRDASDGGGDGDIIITIENKNPEMRVVMNENEVHCDPLSSYRAPIDAVYLASDQTGSDNFQEFMAMCQKPSELSKEDKD